jgi:isopentenyl-diphosphate delta-isomerase
MEYVVLVDERDRETGIMEKQQAHVEGKLHRAISVFIFNTRGELLLQQRSGTKYHSAHLWTNTCCSHPRPGESVRDAAGRRLFEEMGLKCPLKEIFDFTYIAKLGNDLTEYEYDHVFTGVTDALPERDEQEVAAWRYISVSNLEEELQKDPERYTEWFKICFKHWHYELFGKNLVS